MSESSAFLIKACAIWCLLLAAAVLNGALRENCLHPVLGYSIAMPFSGIILAALVFLITWLSVPWLGRQDRRAFLCTGLLWVILTLVFEFVFGHYVRGDSWRSLLRVFDIADGNLFLLVLASALFSPLLSARLRDLLK